MDQKLATNFKLKFFHFILRPSLSLWLLLGFIHSNCGLLMTFQRESRTMEDKKKDREDMSNIEANGHISRERESERVRESERE